MSSDFDNEFAILASDESNLEQKTAAALFFMNEAAENKDIQRAVDVLIEFYNECNQVPSMKPAAKALILYYIHTGNPGGLQQFIKKSKFPLFIIEAVCELAESGQDIGVIIEVIVGQMKAHDLQVFSCIKEYVCREKQLYASRLEHITNLMLKNEKVKPLVSFLVQEGAIAKMEMGPVLPALLPLLKGRDAKVKKRAITSLYWAAGAGNDFSKVIDELEQIMEKEQSDDLAYIVCSYYISRKSFDDVDRLTGFKSASLRLGAYQALNSRLNSDGKIVPQILEYQTQGLARPEEDVRKKALAALLSAQRKEVPIILDQSSLHALIITLKDFPQNNELFEYLLLIAGKDQQTARFIKDEIDLLEIDEKSFTIYKNQLDRVSDGRMSKSCPICRHIPRDIVYYNDVYVPAEVKRLEFIGPTPHNQDPLYRCPECDSYYFYNSYDEYEDMTMTTTIIIKRLDPPAALEVLKDERLASYKENYEALLSQYRADLNHYCDFNRAEAAWALTRVYLAGRQWDNILQLLAMPDTVIRKTTLDELGAGIVPMDLFLAVIEENINHDDAAVRRQAASILSTHYILNSDYENIHRFLRHPVPEVVCSITYRLWMAVRENKFDINAVYDELLELMKSKQENVRMHCRYAFQESGVKIEKPRAKSKSRLDVFITNLSDPDFKIRNEAASMIGTMAEQGEKINKAIPHLAGLLSDKNTVWCGVNALKNCVNWAKAKIDRAVPALIIALNKENGDCREDIITTLYLGLKNGSNIKSSYKHLAALMKGSATDCEYSSIAIFEYAISMGQDISVIKPYIEKILYKGNDECILEFHVKALMYIYTGKRDWESVRLLLASNNKKVPGPAASFFTDTGDCDYSPVIPQLIGNLTHPYPYARERAYDALYKYGSANSVNRDHLSGLLHKNPAHNAAIASLIEALAELEFTTITKENNMDNLTYEQMLEQLVNKEFYLVNFDMVQSSQYQTQRFIFYTGDWFYDVLMSEKSKRITEITWTTAAEFLNLLKRMFPSQNFKQYLRPYTDIPKRILEESPVVRATVISVMEELSDPLKCFQLKTKEEPDSAAFVFKNAQHGWYTVYPDSTGKIKHLMPATFPAIQWDIAKTAAAFKNEKAVIAKKGMIDQIAPIWQKAEEILLHLEQGQSWQEYHDGFTESFYIKSDSFYFYISTQDNTIDTVCLHNPSAVLEAVLGAITANRKPVYASLDDKKQEAIASVITTTLYPGLLKKGKITIGGGFTTDMQWVISCEAGQYRRSQSNSMGGQEITVLSEEQVKEILANKRYGWVRVIGS